MNTFKDEERVIRWIFNSKDEETLRVWLQFANPNNFYHFINKMMVHLIIDEYDEGVLFDEIIKEKGFDYYRQLASFKINEKLNK